MFYTLFELSIHRLSSSFLASLSTPTTNLASCSACRATVESNCLMRSVTSPSAILGERNSDWQYKETGSGDRKKESGSQFLKCLICGVCVTFKIIEANYIGITRGGYYLQPTGFDLLLWVDEEIKLRKRNPLNQEKNAYWKRKRSWRVFPKSSLANRNSLIHFYRCTCAPPIIAYHVSLLFFFSFFRL